MRNTSRLHAVIATVIAVIVVGQSALADQMTKNQYATYWRDACLAKGKSKRIALTDLEIGIIQGGIWTSLEAYHSTMQSMGAEVQSLKDLVAERCTCFAVKIASLKRDLAAPTPDSVLETAFNACE